MSDTTTHPKPHAPAILKAIAFVKMVKGLAMIGLGITALRLMHKDIAAMLQAIAEHVHVDPDGRYMHWLVSRLTGIPARKFEVLGFGAFAYGAVFLVESIGLFLNKLWAEWLTVITTAGLIPLEVYEIFHRFRVFKVVVLAVNVAIVVYLIRQVRAQHRAHMKHSEPAPAAIEQLNPQPQRNSTGV
jgi:uncharacterized membrane protein (DUF2068 family)